MMTNNKEELKVEIYDYEEIVLKNGIVFNPESFVVMAGPCSVESEEQLDIIAKKVSECGIKVLRGGIFKPRTSPYSFQGLGIEGLKILRKVADKYNLAVCTELMNEKYLDLYLEHVDIIQIGARSMQNYDLLKACGKVKKPILLKRGISATINEWLMSAQYIIQGGNKQVILCERGIRTFDDYTRNTLDISSVLIVKKLTNLPVIVDPSHASGRWDLIEDLSVVSLAAKSYGVMIEIHNDPDQALSDGQQSLKLDKFEKLVDKLRLLAPSFDKKII